MKTINEIALKTRVLLIAIGTLACSIAARIKREVAKHPGSYNPVRIVGIDSGWDDSAALTLVEHERVDLGGFHIRDLVEDPSGYGPRFSQVITSQLDFGVAQLDAGPLIPATMFAALIA